MFHFHNLSKNSITRLKLIAATALCSFGLVGCSGEILFKEATDISAVINDRLAANLNILTRLAGKNSTTGESLADIDIGDASGGVGALISDSDYQAIVDQIANIKNEYGNSDSWNQETAGDLANYIYRFSPITPAQLIAHSDTSGAYQADSGDYYLPATKNEPNVNNDAKLSDGETPKSANSALLGDTPFSIIDYLIDNNTAFKNARTVDGGTAKSSDWLSDTDNPDPNVYQVKEYQYISILGGKTFTSSEVEGNPDATEENAMAKRLNEAFNFDIYVLSPEAFNQAGQNGIDGVYELFKQNNFVNSSNGKINGLILNYFEPAYGYVNGQIKTNVKLFANDNGEIDDQFKLVQYDDASVLGSGLGGTQAEYAEKQSRPGNPLVYYEYNQPAFAIMFLEFNEDAVDMYEKIIGLQTGKWLMISQNGQNCAFLLQYSVYYLDHLEKQADGRIKGCLKASDQIEINVCTGRIVKKWSNGDEKLLDNEHIDPYYKVSGAKDENANSLSSFIVSGYCEVPISVVTANNDFSVTNRNVEVYSGRVVLRDYLEGMYAPGAVQDSPSEKIVSLGRMLRVNFKFETSTGDESETAQSESVTNAYSISSGLAYYQNKKFSDLEAVDKNALVYIILNNSNGWDSLSADNQNKIYTSLGWSSADDANSRTIGDVIGTLSGSNASKIESYWNQAFIAVYNALKEPKSTDISTGLVTSTNNGTSGFVALANSGSGVISDSVAAAQGTLTAREMAMSAAKSTINTPESRAEDDELEYIYSYSGQKLYNTVQLWNRDDVIAHYIDTDGNQIEQFGDLHVYDIMDADEIIKNDHLEYFTESKVSTFHTDETILNDTTKERKLSQMQTDGFGTDCADGTQIKCTKAFPSEDVDSIDYATDKSSDTSKDTVQRFYVIAVKGDLFQRQLFSNWIDVQSDTNCLDWWNKYLAACGMNYNVSHQNINDWLSNNYAYELSQNGIVILDLGIVGQIQRMFDQQESNAIAIKLRTIFMILGYILIAYAAVLLLCWTLDVNVGLNVGLLEKATFGHWIAVKYKSDVPAKDSERRSYVYGSSMLIRFVLMIIVAIIMINFNVFRLVIVFVKVFGKLAEHIQNVLQGN